MKTSVVLLANVVGLDSLGHTNVRRMYGTEHDLDLYLESISDLVSCNLWKVLMESR